jgi:hypothetical protein
MRIDNLLNCKLVELSITYMGLPVLGVPHSQGGS